jgi:hypothetical protein
VCVREISIAKPPPFTDILLWNVVLRMFGIEWVMPMRVVKLWACWRKFGRNDFNFAAVSFFLRMASPFPLAASTNFELNSKAIFRSGRFRDAPTNFSLRKDCEKTSLDL